MSKSPLVKFAIKIQQHFSQTLVIDQDVHYLRPSKSSLIRERQNTVNHQVTKCQVKKSRCKEQTVHLKIKQNPLPVGICVELFYTVVICLLFFFHFFCRCFCDSHREERESSAQIKKKRLLCVVVELPTSVLHSGFLLSFTLRSAVPK